jgi:hypothetical protein
MKNVIINGVSYTEKQAIRLGLITVKKKEKKEEIKEDDKKKSLK